MGCVHAVPWTPARRRGAEASMDLRFDLITQACQDRVKEGELAKDIAAMATCGGGCSPTESTRQPRRVRVRPSRLALREVV